MAFADICQKLTEMVMGSYPPKFIIKVGMKASFLVIRRGLLSENQAAEPRPSASHVPLGGITFSAQTPYLVSHFSCFRFLSFLAALCFSSSLNFSFAANSEINVKH